MRAFRRGSKRRAARLAVGSVLCALSLGTVVVSVAEATTEGCRGTVLTLDHSLDGHPEHSSIHQLGTTLAPGTYDTMAWEIHLDEDEGDGSGVGDDGSEDVSDEGNGSHDDAGFDAQSGSGADDEGEDVDSESSDLWLVQFLDRDGYVVGETSRSVPDDHGGVIELGDITLDGPAVEVSLGRVKDDDLEDLYHVQCLGMTRWPDPTTSAVALTTTTVVPSTTAAPTTTAKGVSPTIVTPTAGTVSTAPPQVLAGTLPVTGANTAPLLIVAGASMMLGTSLILGSRRRPT